MLLQGRLLSKYFMKRDVNDIPVTFGTKGNRITIRELMTALGEEVPERFKYVADEPHRLAVRPQHVKPGDICLIIRAAEDAGFRGFTSKEQYDIAAEKGAFVIVMSKENVRKAKVKETTLPIISVPKLRGKVFKFLWKLRECQKGTVVTITGSIGKTTTKDFCRCMAENQFKTYASFGNSNTIHSLSRHLFEERDSDYEVFIQETGAGYPGSIRFASRIMRPNVFIITNVLNHHMQAYGNFDRLFKDKVSGDEFMDDNGTVIVNFDDKNLKKHKFIHQVKSFGIENENVDYRGTNIRENDGKLMFDVYEKETNTTTPIAIEIYGKHNVFNALAAFALGRVLGLTYEQIQENFSKYKTRGIRQMLVNIGGVNIDMDCYNVAEESIMSMLKIGEDFKLEEGGRKIAVIGGENKLGADLHERSRAFGQKLAKVKFDEFVFCGRDDDTDDLVLKRFGDALDISKGFSEKCDTPYRYLKTIDELTDYLRDNVKRGDLVMLKGIYLLDFPISVDRVFGTSFSYRLSNHRGPESKRRTTGYRYEVIEELGEAAVTRSAVKNGKVIIPSELDEIPVYRVNDEAFKGWKTIKSLVVKDGAKNIGREAFSGCPALKTVKLPKSIMVIEDSAFENCASLTDLTLSEGLNHIGEKAFANCGELTSVRIPESIGMIGSDAFEGDDKLTLICKRGSFAHEYAEENQIKYELYD